MNKLKQFFDIKIYPGWDCEYCSRDGGYVFIL